LIFVELFEAHYQQFNVISYLNDADLPIAVFVDGAEPFFKTAQL
jgi:hypothetical protein